MKQNISLKILDTFSYKCYAMNIAITIAEKAKEADVMLKILDEKVLKTDTEIRKQYKDCKYIYIIDSYDKVVDDEGYLYCVSTSDDSYRELIAERDKLEDEGKICVLRGSYNNGGSVGVQYELKG